MLLGMGMRSMMIGWRWGRGLGWGGGFCEGSFGGFFWLGLGVWGLVWIGLGGVFFFG